MSRCSLTTVSGTRNDALKPRHLNKFGFYPWGLVLTANHSCFEKACPAKV